MKGGRGETHPSCPNVPGNPAFSGILKNGELSVGWIGRGRGERRGDRTGGVGRRKVCP